MSQPLPRPVLSFKIGDQPVPGYRLVRELGRGTFGIVWLAVTDNGFERALKVVNLEQRGGKKEFRALRLIKDRKILHGNLLMLVDYWLLDREGTSLNLQSDPGLESQLAPSMKAGTSAGSKVKTEAGPQVQVTNLAALSKGTMIPGAGSDDSPQSVRDTFQQLSARDTKEEENSHAIWLVVAMELGHKTLHDRQKEFTAEHKLKTPAKVSRKVATEVDRKGGTAAGHHTVADSRSVAAEEEEEELLPLPAEEVLPYMEQAARGLDHLHRCEIVHRDVKPQNIMLVGDVAKVCDYGLASELNDIRATTNAFTLPYAAPEAINKNRPTPGSDQYSLAVTYVELRTGRWPFVSNTSTAVYAAKDTGVHHLKFVPKRGVRAVLRKALSKNSADRFPTCGDFVKELAKAERARSSIFAFVQASLAIMAICTVLLAALATHPDIREYLKSKLGLVPPFSIKEFKHDLEDAEKLLATGEFSEAKAKLELLTIDAPQFPAAEFEVRNDALLGLARATAGLGRPKKDAAEQSLSDESGREIQKLLARLKVPEGKQFTEPQQVRQYYLQHLADPQKKQVEIAGFEPTGGPAKSALYAWELDFWSNSIYRNKAPDVVKLLEEVIAQRKAGAYQDARKSHDKFADAAMKANLDAADIHFHRFRFEELHLNHYDESLPREASWSEVQNFIAQVKSSDDELLDRAHLLQLLILDKQRSGNLSLFDPDVSRLISQSGQNIFTDYQAEAYHFSDAEAQVIQRLRDRFRAEVTNRAEAIPDTDNEPAFKAVRQLFATQECLNILVERLRQHLRVANPTALQLLAIQAAWSDLQTFVAVAYPNNSLAAEDAQSNAELGLEVAFVDPQADPTKSLANFSQHVRSVKLEKRPEWFLRALVRAEDESSWTGPAMSPLRELIDDPPQGLKEDRKRLGDWEKRLNALEFRAVLIVDPADEQAINAILARFNRPSAGKNGLVELVKIEVEMAADKMPTSEKWKDWLDRAEQAKNRLTSSSSNQNLYVQLLLARLQLASNGMLMSSTEAGVRELLLLPASPDWLTPTRRRGAEEVLSVLAIRSLELDDSDVLHFADLKAIQNPRLDGLRTAVQNLKLTTPMLNVVEALRFATQGQKTDWVKVGELLSKRDKSQDVMFERQQAGKLLHYVDALAALRSLPEGASVPASVIQEFQQLLEASSAPLFVYSQGPTDDDENILKNLINPIALYPALEATPSVPRTPDDNSALARLWGIKGRLVQRSPNIALSDESRDKNSSDRVHVASELAYRAFAAARKLDDKLEYVVGCGRTMLLMPASKQPKETLKDLIKKYDPDAKSTDPGMRFLVAQNLRIQGYEERDKVIRRSLINQAIQCFNALLADLSPDDPWQLAALCHEKMSDSHLRLAFLTRDVTFAEIHAILDGKEPLPDTKAYHLYHANKHANAQLPIPNRIQPENADIGLANAYEDYAHYLLLSDYYEKSAGAFRQAITSARDDGRDIAEAQMNFGRCLYRYASDSFLERTGTAREIDLKKLKLHLEAIEHLDEAATAKNLPGFRKAEARLWLAQNKRGRARLWSVDEELKDDVGKSIGLMLDASDDLGIAATISKEQDRVGDQMLYLSLQMEGVLFVVTTINDTVRNSPSKTFGGRLTMQNLSKELAGIEETAFELFKSRPAALSPEYVAKFATQAGNRWLASGWQRDFPLRDRWVNDPAVKDNWKQNADWKQEEFSIRLIRVRDLDARGASKPQIDGELSLAEALIQGLDDKRAKIARSQLQDRGDMAALREIAELTTPTNATMLALYKRHLPKLLLARKTRDAALELDRSAPEEKQANDRAKLIQRINATKFDDLRSLELQLTNLEKRTLLEELNRLPDRGAIWNTGAAFLMLSESLGPSEKLNTKIGDESVTLSKLDLARLAHDTLKPCYVLPTNHPAVAEFRTLRPRFALRLKPLEDMLFPR